MSKRTADWPENLKLASMAELEKIRGEVRAYEAQVVEHLTSRYVHESPLNLLMRAIGSIWRWRPMGRIDGRLGQVYYVDLDVIFALNIHETSKEMTLWVGVGGRHGLEKELPVPEEPSERAVGRLALRLLRSLCLLAQESPPMPDVQLKAMSFLELALESVSGEGDA